MRLSAVEHALRARGRWRGRRRRRALGPGRGGRTGRGGSLFPAVKFAGGWRLGLEGGQGWGQVGLGGRGGGGGGGRHVAGLGCAC